MYQNDHTLLQWNSSYLKTSFKKEGKKYGFIYF